MRWQDLHSYWFGDIRHVPEYFGPRLMGWFVAPKTVDDELRRLFSPALDLYRRGALEPWLQEPRGILSTVLLIDQVPRNIYRGAPSSFALDDRALAVAERALAQGIPRAVDWVEEMFLYLPFEHAEDRGAQERSVALFRDWASRAPAQLAPQATIVLDYAIRHLEVIERFGRYPHRNPILGRTHTDAEVQYLNEHPSGF